jgi:hypothetical protein
MENYQNTKEQAIQDEFILSNHAKERIAERVQVTSRKVMKMVAKAWRSKLAIPKINRLEYAKAYRDDSFSRARCYRFYMGHVWVFRIQNRVDGPGMQKVLITVY